MNAHLDKAIDKLKKELLALGAMVEAALYKSVKAVSQLDTNLAGAIIDADDAIDAREVEVEEECLKILALHQPVAIDLRFIVAVLKINNDLERIGDIAVNIAKRTYTIDRAGKIDATFDFSTMANRAVEMLKLALDSLVNMDSDLARKVSAMDDEVDAMKREMIARIKEIMTKDPAKMDAYQQYIFVARHFERIADHASSIAEDVVYMVEGRIVRHKKLNLG